MQPLQKGGKSLPTPQYLGLDTLDFLDVFILAACFYTPLEQQLIPLKFYFTAWLILVWDGRNETPSHSYIHELLGLWNMHGQGHWTCSICLAWASLRMRILLWLALLSPSAPGSSCPMEQLTPCRQLVHSQVTMKPGSRAGQDFAAQLDHHGPCPKTPLALGSSQPSSQSSSRAPAYSISQVPQRYCAQLDWLKFG